MNLQFEGALPDESEVAAIIAAFQQQRQPEPPPEVTEPSRISGWKLAAQYADLSLEDVRALARGEHDVS